LKYWSLKKLEKKKHNQNEKERKEQTKGGQTVYQEMRRQKVLARQD
jgi:hypothetical protein